MSHRPFVTAAGRLRALAKGAQKRFPNGNMTFGNVTYKTGDLAKLFTDFADLVDAWVTSENAVASQKAAIAAAAPAVLKVASSFVSFLRATFGASAEALADFALKPPKAPARKTLETKQESVQKARATRTARGTKGAAQRKKIKGSAAPQGNGGNSPPPKA